MSKVPSPILYDVISSIAVIFVGAFTFFTGVPGLDPLVALLIACLLLVAGLKSLKTVLIYYSKERLPMLILKRYGLRY